MSVRAALAALVVFTTPGAAQHYEFKMISSGPNRPGIPIWNSPFRDILIGLHARTSLSTLADQLHLSQGVMTPILDSLRHEGVVTGDAPSPRPTCMIVSNDEGAQLEALAREVARELLPTMRQLVGSLRSSYRTITGLGRLSFDDVSFFLVSDVLLDNWQINNVESRWLHADRPLRGQSRYYCAFLENAGETGEAFGIYGNQMSGVSGGRVLAVYGNRRGGSSDLTRLSRTSLATLLSLPDTLAYPVLQGRFVNDLSQWAGGTPRFSPVASMRTGLAARGLLAPDGRPLFVVLDSVDDARLSAAAGGLTDSLVAVLTRADPQLRRAWTESRWHDETTFDEFRIWWYHFFYTAVTDQLAASGLIRIPATGVFHYLLVP